MKLIASATALRGSRPIRSILFTVLTLAAMLFCLLAVQPTGAEHAMAGSNSAEHLTGSAAPATPPPASVRAESTLGAPTPPGGGPRMTPAVQADPPALCLRNNARDGRGAAMRCATLLVLGSTAQPARLPSASDLTFVSAGFVVDSFRTIPPHLHRPSLTLLSVSRV